ncbi:TetR-like C-terminal domain-containing protein [Butyrivibrio fibrisolvens]|uniref:TetR-like C-terminal domain-containing protein n=1 Tax=Butyrivibrio fibrisolvens TaxID=831 RepID=UPI0003B3AB40|nr:TetR-like C-terminal domain-containing protein [Butyrivibrio fibrisolvens]
MKKFSLTSETLCFWGVSFIYNCIKWQNTTKVREVTGRYKTKKPERFGVPQKEQPLIMVFYLKGIIGVVTEWVRGGCTESKDEIISVIQKCIIKP